MIFQVSHLIEQVTNCILPPAIIDNYAKDDGPGEV